MDNINIRVKEVRQLLHMSQEEFGKKIGLSKSGISNIEKGNRGIRDAYIKIICNTFNISQEWLCTGIGTPFEIAGWPYYDMAHPNMEKSVKVYESFHDYIESLGYIIQIDQIDELHADFTLIKNGKSVTFTNTEFEQFQEEIKNSVDFQLWKKQREKNQ